MPNEAHKFGKQSYNTEQALLPMSALYEHRHHHCRALLYGGSHASSLHPHGPQLSAWWEWVENEAPVPMEQATTPMVIASGLACAPRHLMRTAQHVAPRRMSWLMLGGWIVCGWGHAATWTGLPSTRIVHDIGTIPQPLIGMVISFDTSY